MTPASARTLERALTAYFLLSYDDERRRVIEYVQRRLAQPDIEPEDERLMVQVLQPIIRSVNA